MRKIKYIASASFGEQSEIEVDDNATDDEIITHILNMLQDSYYIVEAYEDKGNFERIIC